MFVIVGSARDAGAQAMASRWASDGAAVLTCEDLSTTGWRHFPGDPAASRAVVGGVTVHLTDIRGVVVRRPWVFAHELGQVAIEDRDYVAAEMSAFLFAWLADLSCPLFNAPRAGSLCGPGWSPAEWSQAARRAGLRTRPLRVTIPARSPPALGADTTEVGVVDGRCLGNPGQALSEAANRLAGVAGVRWLSVRFEADADDPVFVGASVIPESGDEAAGRMRESFLASRR